MPIYYPDILHEFTPAIDFAYSEKDVMLYALGIGLGSDPMDARELRFVTEPALQVFPTAVTVLSNPPGFIATPATIPDGMRLSSFDRVKVLHGEQKVELHRRLPTSGNFTVDARTIEAVDKGADKGAIVIVERLLRDAEGHIVATVTSTIFARGDGGFGGSSSSNAPIHLIPDRPPNFTVELPTRRDQALLYRLSGDYNPIHSDPATAAKAGFPRPILHGLCTYGLTCRAVVQATGCDVEDVVSHQVRFSSPVFPGETITVEIWRDGDVVSFEASVKERQVKVIRNGKCVLRPAAQGLEI